jgi:hypothetical protein
MNDVETPNKGWEYYTPAAACRQIVFGYHCYQVHLSMAIRMACYVGAEKRQNYNSQTYVYVSGILCSVVYQEPASCLFPKI